MKPEQVRLEALKLTVEHWKGSMINGSTLTADHLIQRAAILERYINEGKR